MDLSGVTTRQELLDELRGIAELAGDAVMEVYRGAVAVELKNDRSPLTAADRVAHAIIRDRLAGLDFPLPLLSEESPPEELRDRLGWQRYWLVDPLDGTKEFIKRNDEFTINIALVDGNRAVIGIVLAPALGLEYAGALGFGAWKRIGGGAAEAIQPSKRRNAVTRVVGSRSHPSGALNDYLEKLGPHEIKPMGSSLKICLVADGQADVYPRFGPTSEWDTAAAQAILESAGGSMINLSGQMLRYNTKESLLNPHFLAIGDCDRDWLAAVPK